jgi:hypothetical protein
LAIRGCGEINDRLESVNLVSALQKREQLPAAPRAMQK